MDDVGCQIGTADSIILLSTIRNKIRNIVFYFPKEIQAGACSNPSVCGAHDKSRHATHTFPLTFYQLFILCTRCQQLQNTFVTTQQGTLETFIKKPTVRKYE